MTAHRQKKDRKYRGSSSHGGGSRKKRRGSGNRGGFGNAGTGKRADQRKFSVLKKYGLSYFGKKGFNRKNSVSIKTINIRDLPETPKINLKEMGYGKLLAKGNPKIKYTIVVDSCSERAKEKIEKSGGIVTILSAKEKPSE
ncbi:MAG: uL15m family ribosomal protein [Nanoarchaeota archaeon]|nr:uL15m family ribosomal protein [Nanoarchaeota archaeon]